jgi:hypothetical protein
VSEDKNRTAGFRFQVAGGFNSGSSNPKVSPALGAEASGPPRIKVLIIRFSSIGDIVLTTPVIRCLKQQLPGSEIHYLTKYGFRQIVQGNPYIDKLHLLEEKSGTGYLETKRRKI